jgi:hypothetical protein
MGELFDKAMEYSRDDPNEAGLIVIAWLEKTPTLDALYGQDLKILGAIKYAGARAHEARRQIRARADRQAVPTAPALASPAGTSPGKRATVTIPADGGAAGDAPTPATVRPPVPKDLGMMARNLSAACNADIWFEFPLHRGLKLGDAHKAEVAVARRTRLRAGSTQVRDGVGLWLLESAMKRTRAAVRHQFTDAQVGAFMMRGRDPVLMVEALQAQEAEDADIAGD